MPQDKVGSKFLPFMNFSLVFIYLKQVQLGLNYFTFYSVYTPMISSIFCSEFGC